MEKNCGLLESQMITTAAKHFIGYITTLSLSLTWGKERERDRKIMRDVHLFALQKRIDDRYKADTTALFM